MKQPHASLSPTALVNHLACPHLTQLERRRRAGDLDKPIRRNLHLDLLIERGLAHEHNYVEYLKEQGLEVVELADFAGDARARTIDAMRSGVDVIVQAALEHGRWRGRADVLLKTDRPSKLGGWSYEVVDTKLTQETKGGTVLQLCLYTELVALIQELTPEWMYVVKPNADCQKEPFRFKHYAAYYRSVKSRLGAVIDGPLDDTSYPEPVPHCEICDWWPVCNERRREDDHLCFVAGLSSLHADELRRQGVDTLTRFAERAEPLPQRPERGHAEAFARAHDQARVQLRGRREKQPIHELILPPEAGRGLTRLPEPCAGDVYFDIEGDHFYDDGGLEYLLGYCYELDGKIEYQGYWATNRTEEKAAFERFIDDIMERWTQWPALHIYHFAPYEPAALKRLMGRHGTREEEINRLLRGERFIDLHAVTRQGVRCSIERYSLKDLEAFHGFAREADLRQSSKARMRLAAALQMNDALADADRQLVEQYNKEDCLSTLDLAHWLERRRDEAHEQGHAFDRPALKSGDPNENVQAHTDEINRAHERLKDMLPADREQWNDEHHALWLLANQLAYFRREDNCAWWEFYRLHELDEDELLNERKALVGLEFVDRVGGTEKCPIDRYRYPAQEFGFKEGCELHAPNGPEIGDLAAADMERGWIDIKKRQAARELHPTAVVPQERVDPTALQAALLDLANTLIDHGGDTSHANRAACDLLLKRGPRLLDPQQPSRRRENETAVEAAVRLVRQLDHGVLAIQGPPGTGKTYTGARMILDLATRGHKIGVTAVSHKVIRNLLDETRAAADEEVATIALLHKVKDLSDPAPDTVEETTDNNEALQGITAGQIVGGTVWLWARKDAANQLDYLFVDEAGQMSLAQVLAASRCARNIVLLGDPQQLEQPQRGHHPEGSEVAALVHLLDGHATIPPDKGLFLDRTWRLHPDICRFTSELYYDGRLEPICGLERQVITGPTPFAGSGLFHVPVSHHRRQHNSPEEVHTIAAITAELLDGRNHWTDRHNTTCRLTEQDILIVAPYNAQVAALKHAMPTLRIGTVDKFQGQEAPIVIYSMTSSTAEDAPRGLTFLYNPNRLNVATSRARCACILVASPRLFEAECKTPGQMAMVNGLCRYGELGAEC